MPNEIPKHLRPTVTVTPTMREAARRAGIDVSRDDVVLRWRHERVCRLRALRKMCREIVAARAPKPLVETPVNVGDDETRDDGDDVDHDEVAACGACTRGVRARRGSTLTSCPTG